MIQPHGGKLVERVLKGAKKDEALERAANLPRIVLGIVTHVEARKGRGAHPAEASEDSVLQPRTSAEEPEAV